MIHFMRLHDEPFREIRSGEKSYEIRLNDQKRKRLRKGDQIEFTKTAPYIETLMVEVLDLIPYPNFKTLYSDLGMVSNEQSLESLLNDTYKTYTNNDEKQWGALAIKIKLLNDSLLRTIAH
ncbi:ASCH domain-containing protein [Thalassobacillus sp. CUG 92003]|uniref:ASCH domain-containing protein n=1 Tax=Thalassobacillus sp. CUG 92003 TaxID=2736641 RepID=UPI0015E6CD4B|nr:ASCH domain-containing protein [Thalassobacillus sp. CUG 92003]